MCRVFLLHREQDFCNFCCKPSKIKFCIEGVSVGEICNTLLDSNESLSTLVSSVLRTKEGSVTYFKPCGTLAVAPLNVAAAKIVTFDAGYIL